MWWWISDLYFFSFFLFIFILFFHHDGKVVMCFVYKSQNKLFLLKNVKYCLSFCVCEPIVEIMMICFNQKHLFGDILFTVCQQPKWNALVYNLEPNCKELLKLLLQGSLEKRERERNPTWSDFNDQSIINVHW